MRRPKRTPSVVAGCGHADAGNCRQCHAILICLRMLEAGCVRRNGRVSMAGPELVLSVMELLRDAICASRRLPRDTASYDAMIARAQAAIAKADGR
jgi:hypothetical protein